MGWHTCEYTDMDTALEAGKKVGMTQEQVQAAYYSSGDVTLTSASGKSWELPDMVPLYVALGWEPPKEFVDSVMSGQITGGNRMQTRSMARPERIGYLDPKEHPLPLEASPNVPTGFVEKLLNVMRHAELGGGRAQTKSLHLR